jgi:pimeloyl-ACP methyl ester carboxylesterase
MRRVVFAHGLESSPDGTKATYLKESVGAVSPLLRHLGLAGQVDALEKALKSHRRRSVLVGSSLGGLAALGVANRAPERISHLVLLAPAVSSWRHEDAFKEAEKQRPGLSHEAVEMARLHIPKSIPTTVIHGMEDDMVAAEDVVALVQRSRGASLILVHDEHQLTGSRKLILSVVNQVARDADPLIALNDTTFLLG